MKILLFCCSLSLASTMLANTYYVSPEGNDAGDGGKVSPWKTIEQANASLKPGDTAIFLPGEYAGTIQPPVSGTARERITYRAERPGSVKLVGKDKAAILLQDLQYITIDGFEVTADSQVYWVNAANCQYLTISNSSFRNGHDLWAPFLLNNVRYSRMENLTLDASYSNPVKELKYDGDGDAIMFNNMFHNIDCMYNIYYKIHVSRAGHDPFDLSGDSQCNVVRECVFAGKWGRNFELFHVKDTLLERNIITHAIRGGASADAGSKLFGDRIIFRRNLIFNNSGVPLAAHAYKDLINEVPPIKAMRNIRFYNNTLTSNGVGALGIDDVNIEGESWTVNNVFKHNIFSENNPDGIPTSLVLGNRLADSNVFSGNILFGHNVGDKTVRMGWPYEYFTLTQIAQLKPKMFVDNFDVDPLFTAPDKNNFSLKKDSPAIDRGGALTVTSSAGKGRVVAVADALYFYDGFGIPGETGDLILIGQKEARIVKRNVVTNELTLDRELEWAAGASVNLPFSGKAPDLGAYEYGGASGPELNNIDLSSETDLGMPGCKGIYCDFEPDHGLQWGFFWAHIRMGASAGTCDIVNPAATGKGSLRISSPPQFKEGEKSNLACVISPANWVINNFPMVRFDYRIPTGVPVGVTLELVEMEDQPRFVCLGGSPDLAVGGNPKLDLVKLIDDGKWHAIEIDLRKISPTYPHKRIMRFRFETIGNGKPNDAYWIDNFRIERQ